MKNKIILISALILSTASFAGLLDGLKADLKAEVQAAKDDAKAEVQDMKDQAKSKVQSTKDDAKAQAEALLDEVFSLGGWDNYLNAH